MERDKRECEREMREGVDRDEREREREMRER